MAPTILNPGDIAIVGYINNGSPDSFSFVNLVPISADTVIYFTDNGWTGSDFRGVTASDADGNENLIKFTATLDIPAGTVIRSIDTSTSFTWTKTGSISSGALGSYADLSLAQGTGTSGDQIAAVQSTGSSPLLSGFTPIYQIDYTGTFENATTSNTGNVISGLSQAGNTAVLFGNGATYAAFNFNTLTNGAKEQWLAAINNPANWTFNSTGTALPTGNLTVNSSAAIPSVNLSVSTTVGSEAGTTAITVTATASSAVIGDQTVNLGVAGTGITAGDYTLSNPIITIPNGATSGSVTFTVVDDALVEGTETAVLSISNPSAGLVLGNTTAQNITIADNDVSLIPNVSITATDANAAESGATVNTGSFTITRTGDTTAALTVTYTVGGTAVNGSDYNNLPGTVTIQAGQSSATLTITPVNDGNTTEGNETVILNLVDGAAYDLGLTSSATVTIADNTTGSLKKVGGFNSPNGAEIPAFDPGSQRLFTVAGATVDIYSISNTGALTSIGNLAPGFTPPAGTAAIPNSVATKNGIVAVAYAIQDTTTNAQLPGRVSFFKASDGSFLNSIEVGYLPDMLTFTPDGTKVLTANEGEPNSYGQATSFDPEGSVSIINLANGVANATVQTAGFTAFNSQINTLKAAGVRIYGPGATVAQDLEPEYIAFSGDGTKAYVTLQENNAIAIVDIATATVTDIKPLGAKDHNLPGNGIDPSDQDGGINIRNVPVFGLYQPDAIASFTVNDQTYYITANEGDSRNYPGFNEEVRVGSSSYVLDPTVFPDAATLKQNTNLGRLQLTNATGDINGDGKIDRIEALGTRSFSIWNANGNQVFDSGDQLERITAAQVPSIFNSDGSFTSPNFDTRSDNKGPEPEGVVIGVVNDRTYAFIGLERTGDVLVYEVTDPTKPRFIEYVNSPADVGPEGLAFISAADSPTGKPLLVTANEVSQTVAVFEFTPPIRISDIQGAGHISPFNGKDVSNVQGIVTAVASNGFYLQDLIADNDIRTSEGIFVFTSSRPTVVVGDAVQIAGRVTEFRPGNNSNNLTTTEIINPTITKLSSGNALPAATILGKGDRAIPTQIIDNDTQGNIETGTTIFDPNQDGIDFYESLEGMLVQLNNPITTSPTNSFGELWVLADQGDNPVVSTFQAKSFGSSQSPYLVPTAPGVSFSSILTVGDSIGGYKMVGIPDGMGAFDNGNGTFTLLMNHELGSTAGVKRSHGSSGAFVSKWIINKSDLSVVSGSDLIQTVNIWNGSGFTTGAAAFGRFCSADLAPVSAFYNSVTGLGTTTRIYLNGEEAGVEGRAFAHIVTGANSGTTYQLPYLGKFSWENAVASPTTSDKTVVAGMDDGQNGQVYFYVGTKTNTGTEIDKAGLNNGKLFGIKVNGLVDETNTTALAAGTRFSLADLGFVQNTTGAALDAASESAGVTSFLRPEDGAWDPSNPRDFYFTTTNSFTGPSRLWRLRFDDPTNPETGGTIEMVLDGTEGQKMFDNFTIDRYGHILLLEDVGNQAHLGKIWQYNIATDTLTQLAQHDPARFVSGGTNFLTQDEEASGIIDAENILGAGWFLLDVQAHYSIPGELVEGGQLLAFFNPDTYKAAGKTARGGSLITPNDFNPERIQIDDSLFPSGTPKVNVGTQLSTIVGVVDYNFNNYEVLPTTAPTVVTPSSLTKEVTSLAGDANRLTVATFNVENLDPGGGAAKFNALASAIVTNLKSPDIISLEEIQDNNGLTNDSVVDASVTYQTLINAIAAAGGPTYQYRQINPLDDTNGGEPGGNIRVGFLYNSQRVTFIDRPGGTSTSNTTVTDIGNDGVPDLSASPGLIDPTNPAFNASRKPLVGEFIFNGQTVYVIGNHFNSKGGDQPLLGPNQPPTLSSEAQRTQQATIVKNFVQSILAINPNANIIIAGDLNDFEFSNPLNILESGGLNNLIETLPVNERYTYNFEGNAQTLDHILVSKNLLNQLNGFDVVHMNSEFADQVSNHDPSVARFLFNSAPTALTLGTTSIDENVSANTIVGTFSTTDPDPGNAFTYSLVSGTGDTDNTKFTISNNQLQINFSPDFETKSSYSIRVRTSDQGGLSLDKVLTIAINDRNDAPVLNSIQVQNFAAINEDPTTSSGTRLSTILANSIVDQDAGALQGIAVTGTTGSGSWQYSINRGTSWTDFGSVSDSSALLLDANTLVRFNPSLDYNGIVNLNFQAWDQTSGTAGNKVDASLNGGSTAFSKESAVSSITINPINDAPVNTVPGNQTATQDSFLIFSSVQGNAISINDVDANGGAEQVKLSVNNGFLSLGNTNGLTVSNGSNNSAAITIEGTLTDLNNALNGLKFTPDASSVINGSVALTIQTNDLGNTGAEGAKIDTDTITISINSANPIRGSVRNGTLQGTTGADTIYAGSGNYKIYGNGGNDILLSGDGNDELYGGAGNDYIDGGNGSDKIYAYGGSNTIYGRVGNDTIYVGSGTNRIDGGLGNDTIYLSGGQDTIALTRGSGIDTIYNYSAGSTRFNLTAGLTYSDLTVLQDGTNTLIRAGSEKLASLIGVQASSVTSSSFLGV